MKKAISLLVAMITISAHAQNDVNAPERKNWDRGTLYGKVKSLTVTQKDLDVVDGKFYASDVESYKFNKNGDVIEHCFVETEDGAAKHQYKYDENRNLIELTGYNAKGVIIGKYVYTYNEHGKIVNETYYSGKDLANYKRKLVRSYDANGLQLGGIRYNSKGEIIEKYDFIYNDKGERIKELFEDCTNIFEYDKNGNRIHETIYDTEGNIVKSNKYCYDAMGNRIEEIAFDNEGKIESRVTRKYNEKGLQTEGIMYNGDGMIIEEAYITYDDNGNIIENTNHTSSEYYKHTRAYTYKYDEKGREIECDLSSNHIKNKFVSKYDSRNNLVLVHGYEVIGESFYLTRQTTYKIKYR